jgi:succinylglutamate desuccinylase
MKREQLSIAEMIFIRRARQTLRRYRRGRLCPRKAVLELLQAHRHSTPVLQMLRRKEARIQLLIEAKKDSAG